MAFSETSFQPIQCFFRWPWINWTYQHFWRLYHILSYCLPTNMDGAGAYYFMEIQGSTLDISDGTEKLRQVLAAKCSWSSGWWSTPRNSERRFFFLRFFLLEMQFRFWKVNLGKPLEYFPRSKTSKQFSEILWFQHVSTGRIRISRLDLTTRGPENTTWTAYLLSAVEDNAPLKPIVAPAAGMHPPGPCGA